MRLCSTEARRALALVCVLLMVAACGRRPGAEPTALPPGTRVAQPTPDFSAPGQGDTAATESVDRAAETVRNRLAQRQAQATQAPTPPKSDARPAPTQSVLVANPELSVFSRPTALGIVVAGGPLYAVPGGGAVVNMQVGATLTITGRSADGGWYAAYLADGTAGWAPASQVRIFGDAAGLEVVQESLGPAVVATMIAESSKPQESLATVAARLTATRTVDSPSAAATPQPDTAPAITGPSVTVVVEGANVRSGPGTDFPIVGGLYQNERRLCSAATKPATGSSSSSPTASAGSSRPLSKQPSPSPNSPSSTLPPPQNPRQSPDRSQFPNRTTSPISVPRTSGVTNH